MPVSSGLSVRMEQLGSHCTAGGGVVSFLPQIQRLGDEPGHVSSSSVQVRNMWSNTSKPHTASWRSQSSFIVSTSQKTQRLIVEQCLEQQLSCYNKHMEHMHAMYE